MSENIIDMRKYNGLKVLFLHLTVAPICYYRMIQYAEHMMSFDDMVPIFPKFEPEVCDTELRSYELMPKDYLPYLRSLFDTADIVVAGTVHRTEFLGYLKVLSDLYRVPLIMESDDAPFNIDGDHPNKKSIGVGSWVEMDAYDQLQDSYGVIVSTNYLAGMLRRFNREIHVIPNALNADRWTFLPQEKDPNKIILGWSGAAGHDRDLRLVKDAFLILLEKYENMEIHTLHGAEDMLKHPRFINDFTWTNINDYPNKLNSMNFDIAVAPLWDSEFNRAKSNLRWLEYSMLGVPCVASPVEPYKNSIEEGKDGLFAATTDEWVDKISQLCDNASLRKRIGTEAKKKVLRDYNSESVARKYADLLKYLHDKFRQDANVDISRASG